MLSIPGLKDLIRTKHSRKGSGDELAGLVDSQDPPPYELPSYLPFLAKRLDIELLALVDVGEKARSGKIIAAGRDGLTCELTLPRVDGTGLLGGLIATGEPRTGEGRIFSRNEVFPSGETWCDLVPMDASVEYVFMPLSGLPLPESAVTVLQHGRRRFILAARDAHGEGEPAFPLKVGLAVSLIALRLVAAEAAKTGATLAAFRNIFKEQGYSIGFVDSKGSVRQKNGEDFSLFTADLLEETSRKLAGPAGERPEKATGPRDLTPEDADGFRVTAYRVAAPGIEPEHVIVVKESRALSDVQTRRERLKLISRFMSSVAHEIKNPLTGIAAGVQYLARKVQPGLEDDETVDFILSEINRLNRIVDDLYKIARPPELVFQQVDLKDVLGKSLICLSEDITRKRLVVEQDIDSELPQLEADPDRLQQVLINIIKNAIEASPEGGTIQLEASRNDSRATVRVTDHGPGISPDDREKIFEPFYSTKERGSGLGLCISQRIIDDHGGSLGILTPSGGGTSFVIEIPIRR